MDETGYKIRPYLDSDFEAEARIDGEVDPKHAATAKEIRRWDELLRIEPDRVYFKLAAENLETKETVAYGSLTQPSFNYDPRWFWVWVEVAPAHREKGIGAGLYDRLEREARSRGGLGMWGTAREGDGVGMPFLERRGFQVLQKVWLSRLDLAAMDLSNVPDRSGGLGREGVRFTTLGEEGATVPGVRRSIHRLSEAAGKDSPRVGRRHPFSYEEFVAMDLEGPGSMPEGMFLAWKGTELVGVSALHRDLARPDTLRIGFTGTHPGFRGQGIGTELKRRGAVFARQRGYRYLVTGNNSENRPILAINRRFGFVPETVWVHSEKRLDDQPT